MVTVSKLGYEPVEGFSLTSEFTDEEIDPRGRVSAHAQWFQKAVMLGTAQQITVLSPMGLLIPVCVHTSSLPPALRVSPFPALAHLTWLISTPFQASRMRSPPFLAPKDPLPGFRFSEPQKR